MNAIGLGSLGVVGDGRFLLQTWTVGSAACRRQTAAEWRSSGSSPARVRGRAENWHRAELGRPMTADEFGRITDRYVGR